MLFLSFDTDRSGKMSSYELRTALKAAGESPTLLLRVRGTLGSVTLTVKESAAFWDVNAVLLETKAWS